MNDIQLITPPAVEPITFTDLATQLQLNLPVNVGLLNQLTGKLSSIICAARHSCEDYTRRAFITQRWLLRLGHFPGSDWRYNWRGYPTICLPKPPLQSVDFLQYVDTFGDVQSLPRDTSYGNGSLQYGYQLERGSDIDPGCIYSAWARPWPPTRMVPSAVLVQFRCGYGGPAQAAMAQGSKILVGPVFNPDDAPVMAGEVGTPVSVPGAAAGNAALNTHVASVDANGQATLADAAAVAVAGVQAWIGAPVPAPIVMAVKLAAEWFYEQGSVVDQPLPRVVTALLDPYRNLVA